MVATSGAALRLRITAHDLPPVVALGRLHVHKLNAYPPFPAMADDGAHLQLSGGVIVMNAEMNFNFRSRRVLNLTQDTHANRAHVRQEAGHEFVRWAKQNAPVGGASGAASAFGRWIVGQMSNRNSGGWWGNASGQRGPAEDINNLLMECEYANRWWCQDLKAIERAGGRGEKDCAGVWTWASVSFGAKACSRDLSGGI